MTNITNQALTPAPHGVSAVDYAVQLATGFGFAVFPCKGDKRPTIEGGFKSASNDPETIQRMWISNPGPLVGVATGRASKVVAIDVDSYEHPEAQAWAHENRALLNGSHTYKTRQGGTHHLFVYPDVFDAEAFPDGIRPSQGYPVQGIDVRGDASYIIYWPANGCDILNSSICPLPKELLAKVTKPRFAGREHGKQRHDEQGWFSALPTDMKDKAVAAALDLIDNIKHDGYEQFRNVSWACTDAYERGAKGAIEAAREWAQRGCQYDTPEHPAEDSDAAFDTIVADYDPDNGIHAETLFYRAFKSRFSGLKPESLQVLRHCETVGTLATAPKLPDIQPTPSKANETGKKVELPANWVPIGKPAKDILPDRRPHLWRGLIKTGTTGILLGPPHVGKTILLADLVCSIAHGLSCMGAQCTKGNVYIAELEGETLVADNVRAWHQHRGLDISPNIIIAGEHFQLLEEESMQRLKHDIEYYNRFLSGGISFVALDTYSQSIAGLDENSTAIGSEAAKTLMAISVETSTTILTVCHTNASGDLRGSKALGANQEFRIILSAAGDDMIRMKSIRLKGSPTADAEHFRIVRVDFPGQFDAVGEQLNAGVAIHIPNQIAKEKTKTASLKVGSAKHATWHAVMDKLNVVGGARQILYNTAFDDFQKLFTSGKTYAAIDSKRKAFNRELDTLKRSHKINFDKTTIKLVDRDPASVFGSIDPEADEASEE